MPKAYFQHLLFQLGSPYLDRVRDVRHLKQPMFLESARRFSFKIFDIEIFKMAVEEQERVPLKANAAFRYSKEVPFESHASTEAAVEAAKKRAFARFVSNLSERVTPTSHSELVVSTGEGRKTRELELIWWPSLYPDAIEYGKLTIRFYVSKTTFQR